jgi:hypothetical protein
MGQVQKSLPAKKSHLWWISNHTNLIYIKVLHKLYDTSEIRQEVKKNGKLHIFYAP